MYPAVSLAEAREARDTAKKMRSAGQDPSAMRQINKRKQVEAGANTFEAVALEWLGKQANRWDPKHAARVKRSLDVDVFPALGHRPIHEIGADELLRVLLQVERRGVHETAARLLQRSKEVFRYGIVTGRCGRNPAVDVRGSLTPGKRRHYPALTAADLPEFLRKLSHYDGNEQTKNAMRLLMLTFVRTGEMRGAAWGEFELEGSMPTWRIPAERMKSRMEHIVPLSWQAVLLLKQQHSLSGDGTLVFPSERNYTKPISENTVNGALWRMGYKGRAVGHGFRSTASTILNEQGWQPDVIERQLAHAPRDLVRAAYNRAQYLTERRKMMQTWSDLLDNLAVGSNVIPLNRRA